LPAAAPPFGGFSHGTRSRLKKVPARGGAKAADVARARRRWMLEQGLFDRARLVFVDETATSTNMARPYGRCAASSCITITNVM
jgi:hypothetical protein